MEAAEEEQTRSAFFLPLEVHEGGEDSGLRQVTRGYGDGSEVTRFGKLVGKFIWTHGAVLFVCVIVFTGAMKSGNGIDPFGSEDINSTKNEHVRSFKPEWLYHGHRLEEFKGPTYSKSHLKKLKERTECTNMEEILETVQFSDYEQDPYPKGSDNTNIDFKQSCFVIFEDEVSRLSNFTGKIRYRLENGYDHKMKHRNVTDLGLGTVFKTHTHACGACSDLKNLATYLGTPDLTNPVRKCGMKLLKHKSLSCLQDKIGLTDACGWIWLWNLKNTKKPEAKGGCLGTCLNRYFSPNNVPFGTFNPCRTCENTINNNPACASFQWKNGEYRLNPCIQCDECRSGPKFKWISGRQRRNSGISSAIKRPPNEVSEVYHFYGMGL